MPPVHICNKEDALIAMDKKIDNLGKDVKSFLKLCQGNGKIGFFTMARLSYNWMVDTKKDKHSLVMYAYRGLILLGLSFIAVKVGLK